MTERLRASQARPLLILGHDGLDPSQFAGLTDRLDGFWLTQGHDEALNALAQGWHTLSTSSPLAGHRAANKTLGPAQPWFGADKTSPDVFMDHMAPVVMPGIVTPPSDARFAAILSKRIFWVQEEALTFCAFFLDARPDGLILLPQTAIEEATETFAVRSGWRPEAARQAIDTMVNISATVADAFPERAHALPLDESAALPGSLCAALGIEVAE